MLPLPYHYESDFAGTKFKYSESVCVWRAYIKRTETEVWEETKTAATADSNMSTLEKLMKGIQI